MKTKLFALQTAGTAATLSAAYLLLLLPDSTVGYLFLSLLLMYATVFLIGFTLAAVAGGLSAEAFGTWRDALRLGWRGWGRAAGVLLVAGGLLYGLHRMEKLRLAFGAAVLMLAILVIPAALGGMRPALARLPRLLAYAALALILAFASWKIISTPAEMSRPWMEMAYLAARVVVAFLVANLACLLLLAAGVAGLRAQE